MIVSVRRGLGLPAAAALITARPCGSVLALVAGLALRLRGPSKLARVGAAPSATRIEDRDQLLGRHLHLAKVGRHDVNEPFTETQLPVRPHPMTRHGQKRHQVVVRVKLVFGAQLNDANRRSQIHHPIFDGGDGPNPIASRIKPLIHNLGAQ
eukprot:4522966-Pyramimonas_sp.AAC.2